MGRAWRVWIAVFLILGGAGGLRLARAYVPTVTSQGNPVTWRGGQKLNLAGNPLNRSGLDPGTFQAAVVKSLQRWQVASGGSIGFDYWQGTDPSIFIPNSQFNGLSSVYFASNASVDLHLSPNVLGLTQVWYDTHSGQILEADIVLNDKSFHFTSNPQDTSGYGSGGPSAPEDGLSKVFVENVLTHELGHAFGLSHSGGLQSTMLFMESPEQAHLGCDEQIGIHALYPGGDAGARGAITGGVLSEGGQPVFGAHVVAVSRRRGTVLATGLSGPAGLYQISALEPGGYFLMIEPYFAGATALPGYYANIKNSICGEGGSFSRGFLVEAGSGQPVELPVAAGNVTRAPELVAHCETDAGAHVQSLGEHSNYRSAPEIFGGGGTGFGMTDRISPAKSAYYQLRAVSGHLEVHALSYSLYSPVGVTLSLLDGSGMKVSGAQVLQNDVAYTGDSGYVNYDAALSADGLEAGDYTIEVTAAALTAAHYPAGALALDSTSFLLLTGSVGEGPPALAQTLPLNARCRMDEHFAPYTSPGGNPPRTASDGGGGSGTGFCSGVLRSDSGPREREGPTRGAMVGWCLPWLVMLGLVWRAKISARAARCGKDPTHA